MATYASKKASVVAIKRVISLPVLVLWMSISLAVSLLCCWSYSHPAWTVRSSQISGSQPPHPPTVKSEPTDHRSRVIRAAISVEPDFQADDGEYAVSSSAAPVTRNTIPLVQIGLYSMCIYSHREKFNAATCVSHAELDYEWLPPSWQVTRVLCGGGCFLLMLGAVASISVLFFQQHSVQRCISKVTAFIQLIAACLMLIGLCFYPTGLHSENLNHLCNDRCQPGWASLVSALASVAALACPVLATLVSNPIYDVNPWEAYLLL